MRHITLCILLLVCGVLTGWAKPTMETHSSKAANAKVTVLHMGAPW